MNLPLACIPRPRPRLSLPSPFLPPNEQTPRVLGLGSAAGVCVVRVEEPLPEAAQALSVHTLSHLLTLCLALDRGDLCDNETLLPSRKSVRTDGDHQCGGALATSCQLAC